jgi:hypothetical protein
VVFNTDGSVSIGMTAEFPTTTTATWTADQAFRLGVLSLADELFVYINDAEIAHMQRSILYSNLPVESFYFDYGDGYIVSPGTIMIDNVSIIPEPAALALFGLGGLMLRKKK